MSRRYDRLLAEMEALVNQLANRVPQPQWIQIRQLRAYRHVERTISQAIVQKLARMVSTLDATRILLNHGFVQEQASLQRVLEEIQEDILFLTVGILRNEEDSQLHQRYLDVFFQEEFDADTAIGSSQKRSTVPRKKIQAYLSRHGFSPFDPSTGKELLRTISNVYSGYIHAASPHVMEMYVGSTGRFHMRGLKGTPIYDEHQDDLRNYFFRAIWACAFAAKSFGDEPLFERYRNLQREFDRLDGTS
ncbi:MAG: hypothetical protein OXG24_05525 [Gammaproteobacteria bacterium]|nr:hypothetical protein [Gammaproteobacteria bacterium]